MPGKDRAPRTAVISWIRRRLVPSWRSPRRPRRPLARFFAFRASHSFPGPAGGCLALHGISGRQPDRMELTQQAAATGSKLFPNTAALGLCAFSIGLGGGSQVIDGVTQRERLVAGIAGRSERTGGATGLYDSTPPRCLKYGTGLRRPPRHQQRHPVTDGANDDPDIPSVFADALLARGK